MQVPPPSSSSTVASTSDLARARVHTLVTIVRHGETSANIDQIWHGSTDTPLTERGRAQAAAVARHLGEHCGDVGTVYASPLQRARHTAEAIAERMQLAPRIEPDLTEFDLGAWEGTPFKVLYEERKLWHHMSRDPHYAPHGGESAIGVAERLGGALRRIAKLHPREHTIVVSHGGALSLALGWLLDDDHTRWERMMSNCAVTQLGFDLDVPNPRLLQFNHTDHLEGL